MGRIDFYKRLDKIRLVDESVYKNIVDTLIGGKKMSDLDQGLKTSTGVEEYLLKLDLKQKSKEVIQAILEETLKKKEEKKNV